MRYWLAALGLLIAACTASADNSISPTSDESWAKALTDTAADGLNPALYGSPSQLAADLASGHLDPRLADPDWHIPRPEAPAETSDLLPAELRPAAAAYHQLRTAMRQHLAIREAGGWPLLPEGPALQAGDRDPSVIVLRERLRISADFDSEVGADPWFFNVGLDRALRRFQERHGLFPSGRLNDATRAAANISVEERIAQLAVTLERWRWLPREFPPDYAWVNITSGTLEVITPEGPALSMRVIVGHPERPTPVMTGELRQVTFNPSWSVPRTIAIEDLLPRQQEDPYFLENRGFHVFDIRNGQELSASDVPWQSLGINRFPYQLRQEPGPGNSLGRIKVAWSNPFDIYLHDTPARGLFGLNRRTLSAGCIRMENAEALATLLLERDRDWTVDATAERLADSATRVLNLKQRLPLYVVYLSAWAEADGTAHFRKDVYGRDARVLEALGDALP